jgi:hypothetical protein
MFEVIVTHREDFREQLMGRFASEEAACDTARQMALQNHDIVIRAWVRHARAAELRTENDLPDLG